MSKVSLGVLGATATPERPLELFGGHCRHDLVRMDGERLRGWSHGLRATGAGACATGCGATGAGACGLPVQVPARREGCWGDRLRCRGDGLRGHWYGACGGTAVRAPCARAAVPQPAPAPAQARAPEAAQLPAWGRQRRACARGVRARAWHGQWRRRPAARPSAARRWWECRHPSRVEPLNRRSAWREGPQGSASRGAARSGAEPSESVRQPAGARAQQELVREPGERPAGEQAQGPAVRQAAAERRQPERGGRGGPVLAAVLRVRRAPERPVLPAVPAVGPGARLRPREARWVPAAERAPVPPVRGREPAQPEPGERADAAPLRQAPLPRGPVREWGREPALARRRPRAAGRRAERAAAAHRWRARCHRAVRRNQRSVRARAGGARRLRRCFRRADHQRCSRGPPARGSGRRCSGARRPGSRPRRHRRPWARERRPAGRLGRSG